MDGAQEVERNRTAQAVSAKVHTRTRRRVSFGEPSKNTSVRAEATVMARFGRRFGWTNGCAERFGAELRESEFERTGGAVSSRGGRIESRQSGQTVVELALLLPVLLLLLIGLIEIGRYAYFDILISNAARAGAQYGAQSLIQAADVAGIRTAAQNDGLAAMTITSLQECGCNAGALGGCPTGGVCPLPLVYVKVTATDTYNSLFSYPGLPASMTLTSTVTMRVSQ
jgi:Flp pilus assembly protein TadG